jgi:RNA polymerase-interacting CarD/CdnL/TRCF family regulator
MPRGVKAVDAVEAVEPQDEKAALYALAVAEEEGYTLIPAAKAKLNDLVEATEHDVMHVPAPGAVAVKMTICKRK